MEKKLLKKITIFLTILTAITFTVSSQTVSQIENIRFHIWADVDAYPDSPKGNNGSEPSFDYAIESIRNVSEFIINGMVYGWEFSYTPYDKKRGVEEYFEVTEINPQSYVKENINYTSPWLEDNLLNCWCNYKRNEYEIQNYEMWSSIHNPVIKGVGYGDVKDGFEGIKNAAKDALKNAIRSYYRNIIKNKPKEIRGSVLIRKEPLIGIESGRYVINLDFFLEWGKIIEYKVF